MKRKPAAKPEANVTVRALCIATDLTDIMALRAQPLFQRGTWAIPSDRIEDLERRLRSLGPDDHTFVAVLDGRVVGTAGLHGLRGKARHTASLGLGVHDAFHGRGIGKRLLAAVLDLADNFLGLHRLELEVNADNHAALRLYEGCGFVVEGRKREAIFRDGAFHDVLVMGRLLELAKAQPLDAGS